MQKVPGIGAYYTGASRTLAFSASIHLEGRSAFGGSQVSEIAFPSSSGSNLWRVRTGTRQTDMNGNPSSIGQYRQYGWTDGNGTFHPMGIYSSNDTTIDIPWAVNGSISWQYNVKEIISSDGIIQEYNEDGSGAQMTITIEGITFTVGYGQIVSPYFLWAPRIEVQSSIGTCNASAVTTWTSGGLSNPSFAPITSAQGEAGWGYAKAICQTTGTTVIAQSSGEWLAPETITNQLEEVVYGSAPVAIDADVKWATISNPNGSTGYGSLDAPRNVTLPQSYTRTIGGGRASFNINGSTTSNPVIGTPGTNYNIEYYRRSVEQSTSNNLVRKFQVQPFPGQNVMSIRQLPSVDIAPTTAGTGNNVWNSGQVTMTGGAARITNTSSSPLTTTVTFSAVRTYGYRYASVVLRSVGSAERDVTIALQKLAGGNYNDVQGWTVKTGTDGTWMTYNTLDFFQGFIDYSTATVSPPYQYDRFRVVVPANTTIEIQSFQGVRKNSSTVSMALSDFPTYDLTNFFGLTDGMPSFRIVGGSIAQAVTTINALTGSGWTATNLFPRGSVEDLFDAGQSIAFLEGRGVSQSGSLRTDLDASTTLTLQSRPIFGFAGGYPKCAVGYRDVKFRLVTGTRIGVLCIPSEAGISLSVDGYDSAHTLATSISNVATTDTNGYGLVKVTPPTLFFWKVSGPSIQTNALTQYQGDDVSGTGVRTPYSTVKGEVAARGVESFHAHYWLLCTYIPTRWLSMDVSPTGRLVQAQSGNSGNISMRFPTTFNLSNWAATDTGIAGKRAAVRHRRVSVENEIVLVYEAGGGIKRSSTINEGGSFSVATTITSAGEYPALWITKSGNEIYAWRTSTGAIQVRVLSAFGTDLLPGASPAVVTAVPSGVAASTITLGERIDGQTYVLSYYNTSGNIVTVSSSDGGVTWA